MGMAEAGGWGSWGDPPGGASCSRSGSRPLPSPAPAGAALAALLSPPARSLAS